MELWLSAAIGTLVGILGTGLGGLLVVFIKNPGPQLPSFLMGFSGGIMLSVVGFDMVPEAVKLSGFSVTVPGLVLGAAALYVIHRFLPHFKDQTEGVEDLSHTTTPGDFLRLGVLLCLGIALHNLPEGLAIGSGMSPSHEVMATGSIDINGYGFHLAILLLIHNVPEGVALAVPLKLAGRKLPLIVLMAALAGLPTGVGALIGGLIGGIGPMSIGLSIAFAGGAMLFVTVHELVPEALKLGDLKRAAAAVGIGVLAGGGMVIVL